MYNLCDNRQVFEGGQSSVEVEVGNYVLTIATCAKPRIQGKTILVFC
jgi:hypothetical protein